MCVVRMNPVFIFAFFLFWQTPSVPASPISCCTNSNIIVDHSCRDGNFTPFDCQRYLLEAPDFVVGNADYLLFPDNTEILPIPRDRYCTSVNENGTELALVCALPSQSYTARIICTFISVFFLMITIAVYYLVADLRDLQGECTLNSLWGLGHSFFFLAFMQMVDLDGAMCVTIALLIYGSFLYAFFWLNILAVQIWRTIVKQHFSNDRIWRIGYYSYGVGAPLLFLILLIVSQHMPHHSIHPHIGTGKCWFNELRTTFIYFYGPIIVILCVNLILFIWTSVVLWKEFVREHRRITSSRNRFCLSVKLFFIMGLSWIFEVLSAVLENPNSSFNFVWTITDYINSLQGVLIFVLLVATRKRALRGLGSRKICGVSLPSSWKKFEDDENEGEEEGNS